MSLAKLSKDLVAAVSGVAPSLATILGRWQHATAVAWEEGTLVTAAHNLPRRGAPRLRLGSGETVDAEVLGADWGTDLALLRGPALPVPRWSDSVPAVGAIVIPVDRTGDGPRATLGMVSAVGGPWRTARGGDVDAWIDVDGSLPRGFSGGPLLGADGSVIGLNTRELAPGGTTLPTATVRRVVGELSAHGQVRRGWLGVGVQPSAQGLLVNDVVADGPAAKAGILVGDVLVQAGGRRLASIPDLLSAVRVGEALALGVSRGGELREIRVTPGERASRC